VSDKTAGPYTVEEVPGCYCCNRGGGFDVIGPNGARTGPWFAKQVEAEEIVEALNAARAAGALSVRLSLHAAVQTFSHDDSKGMGHMVDVLEPFMLSDDEIKALGETVEDGD
jgi:hypothetical protein